MAKTPPPTPEEAVIVLPAIRDFSDDPDADPYNSRVVSAKIYSQQLVTRIATGVHDNERVLRAVAMTTSEIFMLQVQLANIAFTETDSH